MQPTSNMRPSLTIHNFAYRLTSAPHETRKFILRKATGIVLFANLKNPFVRKYRKPVFHSLVTTTSSFCNHIGTIFSRCSKEKMVGITAQLVIAFVAHKKAACDLTISKFPRQSMTWNWSIV